MKFSRLTILLAWSTIPLGCTRMPTTDHPQLTPAVRMEDVRFYSNALLRNMVYRVIIPTNIPANTKLPVIWLLHGAGANYLSWSNDTAIAKLVEHGVILIMPDAFNTYYINSANGSNRRYEDYLVDELIPHARAHFPIAEDRAHNAVIGISRGGFAAVLLSLKHPQLFSYVGGMSSALDLAERPSHWRRPLESIGLRNAFGPRGSEHRRSNDPFFLLQHRNPGDPIPYFYFTCGEGDPLLPSTQRFTALLNQRNIPVELHTIPGEHNWTVWNAQLPGVEASVLAHLGVHP